MAHSQDPSVEARRLRSELRRARQDARLTQKDVADALDWSTSKLIRIERGAVGISITDLRALAAHYGMPDERTGELVEMARASKQPAWWTKYRQVLSPQLITLLGYEASATTIRHNNPSIIPGLLQTEEYARAMFTSYNTDPSTIDDRVTARLERQGVLDREDPPEMRFVLDEAVIRRWVGGASVMRGQLEWLREIGDRPHVSIQIIPFSAGEHRGMAGSFALYEFPPDEDEDYVVFLEDFSGLTQIRNDSGEASAYLDRFMELEKQAISQSRSSQLIDEAIEQLRHDRQESTPTKETGV
jgi:transcriptional regulator with XRE-family HTH domain